MILPALVGLVLLQPQVKDVVVTGKPGKPVHLKAGGKLFFYESANPSTGGRWQVVDDGKPALAYLTMVMKAEKSSEPPVPGRGGTAVISFQGMKKGKAKVKLVYGRPWEKGKKPWDEFTANVVVD